MKTADSLPVKKHPKLPAAEWVVQAKAVDDVLDEMNHLLRNKRRRRVRVAKTSAAALVLFFLGLWLVPLARHTAVVETRAANQQQLVLADGSRVELNANTELRTDFRYGRRVVQLRRGEAFFTVAKDAAHPFLVETPSGVVRVTGTEFNVRATGVAIRVTLVEGSVSFASDGAPIALEPRQQLDAGGGSIARRSLSTGEINRSLAWRTGRAVFDGDTLASAASRFASYHDVRIDVSTEAANLLLGGSYPLAELKEFLSAIETTLGVQVQHGDREYRISLR